MLEPARAFNAYAKALGWQYLGDEEEDAQSDELQRIPGDLHVVLRLEDGSVYGVPVRVVALNRATYYAKERVEFDGVISRSLREDTVPLFLADPNEAADWADGNMDFAEVENDIQQLIAPRRPNLAKAWASETKKVNTRDALQKLDEATAAAGARRGMRP